MLLATSRVIWTPFAREGSAAFVPLLASDVLNDCLLLY